MNKKNRELLEKFLSIFLTALISAMITFLQTLVVEPSAGIEVSKQITQAGVIGTVLRAGQELIKTTKYI